MSVEKKRAFTTIKTALEGQVPPPGNAWKLTEYTYSKTFPNRRKVTVLAMTNSISIRSWEKIGTPLDTAYRLSADGRLTEDAVMEGNQSQVSKEAVTRYLLALASLLNKK